MSTRLRLVTLSALLAPFAICWQLGRAEDVSPQPGEPAAASTDLVGGPERYLTHVSTDKPIYRPGESMYVRGVVLHHLTNKPLSESISAAVEVIGPKGDVVASGPAARSYR